MSDQVTETPADSAPQPNPTLGQQADVAPDSAGKDETATSESRGWRTILKRDYQTDPDLEGIESATDLFLKYKDARGAAEGAVKRPGEEASDEDWAAYYAGIGVPESPDGYKLPNAPAELDAPETYRQGFQELAHKAKLTPEQATAVYNALNEAQLENSKAMKQRSAQARTKAWEALRGLWGDRTDDRVQQADAVGKRMFGDRYQEFLKRNPGLADDPDFVAVLASFGDMISEDTMALGRPSTQSYIPERDPVTGMRHSKFKIEG